MNLLAEFGKYIFNIVIVLIISTVIIIRFLIDSISRHKTFKKVVRGGRYEVVGRGVTNWYVEVVRTGRSIIFCVTKW